MQQEEIIQQIIQMADKFDKKPDEFINEIQEFLENVLHSKNGDSLFDIGLILFNYSYFNLALYSWKHALKYYIELGDRAGESNCYINLGYAYRNLGNYTKAINYQEKALEIKKEIGDSAGESSCYINLGIAYGNLGDHIKDINYQEKALEIKKEIGDRAGESDCYIGLGNAYDILGDHIKAIDYQEKALNIAKEIGDRAGESDCYIGLGNAYDILGDYAKDINYQEKALEIKKEIGDRAGESSCYGNLGNAYRNLGDHIKAIDYYEKTLEIKKEIGDTPGEASAHLNLGIIYNEQKPGTAYNNFRRSIELTEFIGGKIIQEEYKMAYYASRASSADAYQLMVLLCLRLGKDKEAFEYAERSKSKVFLYLLASSNIRPSVPKVTNELRSLLDDEENYLVKLRQVQNRHSKNITGDSVTTLVYNDAAVGLDRDGVMVSDYILSELNKIYDKIEPIDPEYVFLRRGRPLPLGKMQDILSRRGNNHDTVTILVEYFTTKDKTFIFVISPKEFHIKTIELSSEKLASYIQNYWREVVNYPLYRGNIGSTWLELSQYLIEPISESLSHAHLIYFVPYGLLHYIPLHALELDGDPLIKNHAVAYSPSASLLQFYKNKGSGFLKTCASFGIVFKEESEEVANLFFLISS